MESLHCMGAAHFRTHLQSPLSTTPSSASIPFSRRSENPSGLHFRPPFLGFRTRPSTSGRGHVISPGSPPPEPENQKHPVAISGLTSNFYRARDGVRIFFAVLFWMSLFFWSSAWDENDKDMPNKRSWFRR